MPSACRISHASAVSARRISAVPSASRINSASASWTSSASGARGCHADSKDHSRSASWASSVSVVRGGHASDATDTSE